MLGVCSIMGLPWFVAATVLSITHVNSLKLESECSAPGEQPKFLGIREQRVTGLMIFVLMGCSVFMTAVLKVFLHWYAKQTWGGGVVSARNAVAPGYIHTQMHALEEVILVDS